MQNNFIKNEELDKQIDWIEWKFLIPKEEYNEKVSNIIEEDKIQELKEAANKAQEENLIKAETISKEIKWWKSKEKEEGENLNFVTLNKILNTLTDNEKKDVLDSILLWYDWTKNWRTQFHQTKEKVIDDWFQLASSIKIRWMITIKWKDYTFNLWLSFARKNKESNIVTTWNYITYILQDIAPSYKPSLTTKVKSEFKQTLNWILKK